MSGERLLLVEDEALIGLDLRLTLEERGFVVEGPVRTEAAAMKVLETAEIAMALLDINLGRGRTSFGIARILADQPSGVGVAAMAGERIPERRLRGGLGRHGGTGRKG